MKRLLSNYNPINPIANIIVSFVYAYVYSMIYDNYIAVDWAYSIKQTYVPMQSSDLLLYLLLCSMPFVLYKGARNIASVFSLFIYIFIYVPFINSLLTYSFPNIIMKSYLVLFFVIMVLLFYTDRICLYSHSICKVRGRVNLSVVEILTFLLFVFLLAFNTHELKFVNFFSEAAEMYELRGESNINFIYVLCWIRSVFLPLLTVYYMYNKKYIGLCVCTIGFLLLFMLDKQKMTIVFPFAITAIVLIGKVAGKWFSRYFHIALFSLFIIIPIFLVSHRDNLIIATLAMIFVLRIQCIAGMQIVRYIDFFVVENNPFTYFSHIGIINSITGMYPYSESIGQAINTDESNSNATFFLMDGVASCGIIGCIIIATIFIIMKSILNSLSYKYSVPVLTAMFLFPLQSLMNVSLFTALITHGIILIFLILVLFKFRLNHCN